MRDFRMVPLNIMIEMIESTQVTSKKQHPCCSLPTSVNCEVAIVDVFYLSPNG